MNKPRFISHSAIIAALYAALTILLAPLSFGAVQIRISEALTFLAAFTPAAIPGLFIGCLIANIYFGNMVDIIFGSLTTLAAAVISYKLRKRPWLVPLPPVLLNALVVGYYISLYTGTFKAKEIVWYNMFTVGAGQLVACYIIPIYFIINYEKFKNKVNPFFEY